MKLGLILALVLGAVSVSAKEEAPAATILVVRIGPFSEQGIQLVSGRHLDLIECDIVNPTHFRRPLADLVLVPNEANKRFAKEEGRYAKLLLRETDLKERLAARLPISIPSTLPTVEKIEDLGEPTPVSMTLPDEEKAPNQSPEPTRSARGSS